MRFKKLKRNVATALIIFILVVGGILATGFIQSHSHSNSQVSSTIYTNKGGVLQVTPTQTNTQPTPTPQVQQPTFTFFDSGVRTRAS